jgi:hypothetical protein
MFLSAVGLMPETTVDTFSNFHPSAIINSAGAIGFARHIARS